MSLAVVLVFALWGAACCWVGYQSGHRDGVIDERVRVDKILEKTAANMGLCRRPQERAAAPEREDAGG